MCPEALAAAAMATDYAFTPGWPDDTAALKRAADCLQKHGYSIALHRPSCIWVLHLAKAEEAAFVKSKLQTIRRNTDVRFLDVMPLDRFHGEVMGLAPFVLPTTPQLVQEPVAELDAESELWQGVSQEDREQIEREHRLLIAQLDAPMPDETPVPPSSEALALFTSQVSVVKPMIDESAIQLVKQGYDEWNNTELHALPTITAQDRDYIALQLAGPAPKDWLILGGPVLSLNFYNKKCMAHSRQLAWTLFRMQKAGLTPKADAAHYIDFLKHYMAIASDRRRDHVCEVARRLWELWTKAPFPELPTEVACRERALRIGRVDKCVVCQLPTKLGLVTCGNACAAYACKEHRCVMEVSFTGHSAADCLQLTRICKNLDTLLTMRDIHAKFENYPIERNRVCEQAIVEMKRDGCCCEGYCATHAPTHRLLNRIDSIFQGANGVRLQTIEAEIERLRLMKQPMRMVAVYKCSECEKAKAAAIVQQPVHNRVDPVAFMAWMASPIPEGQRFKRPFAEWDADQHAEERQAKWARLSAEQQAVRWNPTPGSMMSVPMPAADTDSE